MMNILVTGSSGFIGSSFLPFLLEKNNDASIYVLTSNNKTIKGCKTIQYNLSDLSRLQLPEFLFDIVYHIGAFTPKQSKQANDIGACNSNIEFTKVLLEKIKCNCFIFLSTLDVYTTDNHIVNESTNVEPVSLYGYSKLFCEKMIEIWSKERNTICQILRIGHIYGPGEAAYRKVIPVTIEKVLNGESPEIWGEGEEKRAFLYIDDCVQMIYNASKLKKSEGIINIASGKSYSVKEIIRIIQNESNSSLSVIQHPATQNARSLIFDNTKMQCLLGEENVDFKTGIANEIAYFKQFILDGNSCK